MQNRLSLNGIAEINSAGSAKFRKDSPKLPLGEQ
jgi:hypothetical protein